ncbi:acyl-CoA dehydrogenase family protein [Dactylosporangium sp. CA-233914]|uniref:acyl-CoA dehydrogenase family protein n=1 Tax=Dactylosporangium sp. CA-233914 TaxID=3239934 RepID=UPI003D920B7E
MSYSDFLDAELAPLVRRMADRPRHGEPDLEGDRAIRAMVWQGLMSLGLPSSQSELVELALLLGSVLYQGPLLDTVTARESGVPGSAALALHGSFTSAEDRITGSYRFVGFAPEVSSFFVIADRPALVLRDHPTVSLRRHEETGRGELYHVRFDATPATFLPEFLPANARIRQAAYLVGLSQGALDLAVERAKQRRQFGQPIGRFQALAFRLAELSIRIDAARLLTRDTARDADHGRDVRLTAAHSLSLAAELARTVTTTVMQVHGAAGMADDSDAQLFYRRAAVESLRLGSPTQLRTEVAPLLTGG